MHACQRTGALGVITETPLVRRLGLGQADFFTTQAGAVTTPEFTACAPVDLLSDVLTMMHARGLIHVLVVDAGRHPIGVLSAGDGLRALLAAGNHEVIARLASNAIRGGPGAGRRVHPNDDVNLGQSSNDVFPTAIEVDARRAESMVANSLMGVTALVPHIGYDRASRVAHHAHAHGMALRQAALEAGGVSAAEYDTWVDMRRMSVPG